MAAAFLTSSMWLVALTLLLLAAPQPAFSSSDSCGVALSNQLVHFKDPFPLLDGSQTQSWFVKTPSMLRRCLTSFPLDSKVAAKTIDSLLYYLDFYVFLEQNRNSGAPYNLSVNLDANLRYLKASMQNFTSAYDFEVAVRETVRQSRDGHLHYNLPKGFAGHFVIQPLALEGELDEQKKLRFFVKGDVSQGLHERFFADGPRISDYKGWEVVSVDGLPTMDAIRRLATDYPIGKDDGVNFNWVLFHLFNFRTGILPDQDQITFVLQKASQSVEIAVSYLVLDTNRGRQTIAQLNSPKAPSCSQWKRSVSEILTQEPVNPLSHTLLHRNWFRNETKADVNATFKRSASATSSLRVLKSLPGSESGLLVFNEDTLVLRLASFMPPSNNFNGWIDMLNFIVQNGRRYKRLIIDIRDNTGGVVCLGTQLASLIRGGNPFASQTTHDVRKSTSFDRYLPKMPVYTPNADSVQSTRYLLNQIYSLPDRVHTRGGAPGRYSAPFKLDCRDFIQAIRPGTRFPFDPATQITVLSNGVAISTAASFVKAIKGVVPIAVVGGDPEEPISASFSIGNPVIVNTASLYELIGCAGGYNGLSSFPKLPTSADIGLSFAEAYEHSDQSLVAEFVRDTPNIRLPIWKNGAEDSEEIYGFLSK